MPAIGTVMFLRLIFWIMLPAISIVTDNGALHEAVKRDDINYVRYLLNRQADVNAVVPPGDTPLLLAARLDHAQIAETLLAAGAAIDVRSGTGDTALHVAARTGNMKTLRVLLAASGADPNVRNSQTGTTPLHLAAGRGQVEVAQALLASGADRKATDGQGKTPLDWASRDQHLSMIKLLGADAPGKHRSPKK